MIPNPLPANLVDHALYPALTTAVRDLATSNIMTAVMLTGLVLLQVCMLYVCFLASPPFADVNKAGRYYAKRPAFPPVTAENSSAAIPVSQRSATPFRELTEDESSELDSGRQPVSTSTH